MAVDGQIVSAAAAGLNALAKAFERSGETEKAEPLYRQAAQLELGSPDLQNCWGGPLNGQVGRQAIFLDVIDRVAPVAVIETGTFRGITTEWLARNFSGPILTCEKEKFYFLQAHARLSAFPNVDLRLEDSRSFLRQALVSYPKDCRTFIYLDSHWERDLPLREELRIIFSCQPNAVVAIDDFRVPCDIGYGWDDYGPGQSLDIDYVKDVIPHGSRLFFPQLRSADETGAVRGCCIVAVDPAQRLDASSLLRGADLEYWSMLALGAEAASESPPPDASSSIVNPHESYPEMITTLTSAVRQLRLDLAAADADRRAKQDVIDRLVAELAAVDPDRHAKQA